jgi:hypothetical protein
MIDKEMMRVYREGEEEIEERNRLGERGDVREGNEEREEEERDEGGFQKLFFPFSSM